MCLAAALQGRHALHPVEAPIGTHGLIQARSVQTFSVGTMKHVKSLLILGADAGLDTLLCSIYPLFQQVRAR